MLFLLSFILSKLPNGVDFLIIIDSDRSVFIDFILNECLEIGVDVFFIIEEDFILDLLVVVVVVVIVFWIIVVMILHDIEYLFLIL